MTDQILRSWDPGHKSVNFCEFVSKVNLVIDQQLSYSSSIISLSGGPGGGFEVKQTWCD